MSTDRQGLQVPRATENLDNLGMLGFLGAPEPSLRACPPAVPDPTPADAPL
jgi:hypothetical protein